MRNGSIALVLSSALLLACPEGGDGPADGGAQAPLDEIEASVRTSIPGLVGDVEVVRDTWGVAHVFCTDELDCFRAEGYVQAHDRLFELDFYRHLAGGRLGGLVGNVPGVRGTDRFHRRMFTTREGRPVSEGIAAGLSGEARAAAEAFTEGVNAFIDHLFAEPWAVPSPEYESGLVLNGEVATGDARPAPWTVEDSLNIGRLFALQLSDNFATEVEAARWAARLDPADFVQLYESRPIDPTFILPGHYGGSGLSAPLALPDTLPARLRAAGPALEPLGALLEAIQPLRQPFGPEAGSNNWIVAPEHTATGRPLLANDPHLQLLMPSVWWTVHLDAVSLPGATGTLQASGNAFPGVPVILIGRNDRLAWGVTVVGYDVSDAYVETVTGVDTVRFQGADVAVQKVLVRMPNGFGEDAFVEEKICVVPHHGPIMSVAGMTDDQLADPALPCVDPALGANAVSVRWTGQEPSWELETFRRLMYADDVEEAKEAISFFEVGAQNFVVADSGGRILYYPHAKVPIRDGDLTQHPPFLPLPGEGGAEWTGYIPSESLPQALDPAKGYVVTANNDIVGFTEDGNPLNDPWYLYYTNAVGLRGGRITRLLEETLAAGDATEEDMKRIQLDTRFTLAERILPFLLQAAQAAPGRVTELGVGPLVERLGAWDFATPTGLAGHDPEGPASSDASVRADAVATTIFSSFLWHALDRTYADELRAAGIIAGAQAPSRLIKSLYFALAEDRDGWFDDVTTAEVIETREDSLLRALADARDELEARLGADPGAWLWGRLHVNVFSSPLGAAGAFDPYGLAPVANDGGHFTVDPANFGRSYRVGSGASMRLVADVGETIRAWQILPGGEVDHLDSQNRADQLPLWLEGEYLAFPFELDEAAAAAQSRAEAGLTPGARWVFTP